MADTGLEPPKAGSTRPPRLQRETGEERERVWWEGCHVGRPRTWGPSAGKNISNDFEKFKTIQTWFIPKRTSESSKKLK
jgi:hypothetical protein